MQQILALIVCTILATAFGSAAFAQDSPAVATANPVVDWNRALLVIVRTKGAQPATVHPTRSFAIMHAAIYDAVNAIDRSHEPNLVELSRVPATASKEAATSVAAHDVLTALYPEFQATLDSQLSSELAALPADLHTAEGEDVGHAVAAAILDLRSHDGSAAQPPIRIHQYSGPISVDATKLSGPAAVHPLVARHTLRLDPCGSIPSGTSARADERRLW